MFSISSVEDVLKYPSVAIEVVSALSASELIALYQRAKIDESFSLDAEPVIQALFKSEDRGKLLALALYSAGGKFANGLTGDQIIQLANVSQAHKIAVLSNSRINWYSFSASNESAPVVEDVLMPVLVAISDKGMTEEACALICNPRMKRDLIADLIAGKGDFSAVHIKARFLTALRALPVKKINDDYPEKEMPSANDREFDKPAQAFLGLLRAMLNEEENKHFVGTHFSYFLPEISRVYRRFFKINISDWLSADDLKEIEVLANNSPSNLKPEATTPSLFIESLGRKSKWNLKTKAAKLRFVEWAISIGENEPLTVTTGSDFERVHKMALGSGLLLLCVMALTGYTDDKGGRGEYVTRLIAGESWFARSCGLAAQFQIEASQGDAEKIPDLYSVLKTQGVNPNEHLRGLALTERFWKAWAHDGRNAVESLKMAGAIDSDLYDYVWELRNSIGKTTVEGEEVKIDLTNSDEDAKFAQSLIAPAAEPATKRDLGVVLAKLSNLWIGIIVLGLLFALWK